MKRIGIIIIIIAVFFGCKEPEMLQKPYVTLNKTKDFQRSYYLPKNTFHVQVEIMRSVHYKGPFVSFTEQYLKLEDGVVKYNETNYNIVNTDIQLVSQPDPDEQFFIQLDPKKSVPLTISPDGILAGINVELPPYKPNEFVPHRIPYIKPFVFSDLSIKPIVDIKEEISYEYKRIDSNLVRVPKEDVVTEVKNFQQLAWSAAKFISTLRENRFRLLAGVTDSNELPQSVKDRIKELNRLEQSYLELFIGHVDVDTLVYNFYYEPNSQVDRTVEDILFYFSPGSGITEPKIKISGMDNNGNGAPVAIVIEPMVLPLGKQELDLGEIDGKGLVYRLPGYANVSVEMRNETLAQKHLPVAQWGSYEVMPPKSLKDSVQKIRFDIRTGQLLKEN